jgi:two-component system, response regulator YesN
VRVLIVDDEPSICEGLAILSRKALGPAHTVASESDPLRALQHLETGQYDLLITDISMPEIDGLELTRRARSLELVRQVIIVTGFDEFDYAREALRQGAVDFLLKPIDKEELATALRRVDKTIGTEETPPRSDPLVAQALLPGGTGQTVTGEPWIAQFGGSPTVSVVVTTMKATTQLRNLARIATQGLRASTSQDQSIVVVPVDSLDAVAALVPLPGNDDLDASTLRVWRELMQGSPLGVAVAKVAQDRLETIADHAYSALMAAAIYDEHVIVWRGRTRGEDGPGNRDAQVDDRDLISPRTVADAIGRIVASGPGTSLVRADTCRQLARLLSVRVAIATGVPTAALSREVDHALLRCRSVGAVLEVVRDVVARIEATPDRTASAADRVIATIRAADPADLYLQGVADRLGLSPGYVSAVLKEKTGKSFAVYASELRMELARQLLREVGNLTVQQVAQSVGFTSPRQFYRQFKRHVGLTPSDFRSSITEGTPHDE